MRNLETYFPICSFCWLATTGKWQHQVCRQVSRYQSSVLKADLIYIWIWLIILPQRILLNCCKSDRKNHSTHANTSKTQHKGFIEVIIQLYGPRSPPNPHKPSYFIKAVWVVTSYSLHNGTSGGNEPPIYHLRQGSESIEQWKIKYNCKFKFGQYSRRMIMLKLRSRVEF